MCIRDSATVVAARAGKLQERYEEKKSKYSASRAALLSAGYASAEMIPLLVGALGEWYPGSDAALLKVSNGYQLKKLRQRIIAEAITGSAACYFTHTARPYLAPREYRETVDKICAPRPHRTNGSSSSSNTGDALASQAPHSSLTD